MPEGQFSHEMSKFREQTDSKIMILAKKKKISTLMIHIQCIYLNFKI